MEKIKIYIPVCDLYLHCIPVMKYSMDKYWGDNLDVHIVAYTEPDFDLGNWKFHSLGKSDGSKYFNSPGFCAEMYRFFSTVEDDIFLYLDPDGPMISQIDIKLLDILIKEFDNSNISRVELTKDLQERVEVTVDDNKLQTHKPGHLPYKEIDDYKLIKLKDNARGRNRLSTSIWRREYFLMSLKNMVDYSYNIEAGDFEGSGDFLFYDMHYPFNYKSKIPEEIKPNYSDYVIIGSLDKWVLQIAHLYSAGKLRSDWFKDAFSNAELSSDDRKEIKRILDKK